MISSQKLGERIADARKKARLTQADVAERLGLARTTLVAIEKGERRPANAELVQLAGLLGVSVHSLLDERRGHATVAPRFRLPRGADKESVPIARAVDRVRSLGERYAELERMQGLERPVFRLEALQTYRAEVASSLDPKLLGMDAAATVRGLLGLGDDPALNIEERLELESGLRIFHLDDVPWALSAVLIWSDAIGACVGVNRRHSLERRRWSLAHEFGHFLRDRELGDIYEGKPAGKEPAEIFADSFAGAFLMPAAGVARHFADRCRAGGNRFTALDVFALARTFQISFEAMALRLEEQGLLPRGTYNRVSASKIRPRDQAEKEGGAVVTSPPDALPRRYVDLAVHAFDAELISEGELAQYLDVDRVRAREIYLEHEYVPLDDGRQLPLRAATEDLRA